jgi:hypothetical protein
MAGDLLGFFNEALGLTDSKRTSAGGFDAGAPGWVDWSLADEEYAATHLARPQPGIQALGWVPECHSDEEWVALAVDLARQQYEHDQEAAPQSREYASKSEPNSPEKGVSRGSSPLRSYRDARPVSPSRSARSEGGSTASTGAPRSILKNAVAAPQSPTRGSGPTSRKSVFDKALYDARSSARRSSRAPGASPNSPEQGISRASSPLRSTAQRSARASSASLS